MRPYMKIAKLSDYGTLFNAYLARIKKERPGITFYKIDSESDISLWISGRRGLTSEV